MEINDETTNYWLNKINHDLNLQELSDIEKKNEVSRYIMYHASIGGLMDTPEHSLIGKSKEYLLILFNLWVAKFLQQKTSLSSPQ